jgi:hypothetical protein
LASAAAGAVRYRISRSCHVNAQARESVGEPGGARPDEGLLGDEQDALAFRGAPGHQPGEEVQDLRGVAGEVLAGADGRGDVVPARARVGEAVVGERTGQLLAQAVTGEPWVRRAAELQAGADERARGELDVPVVGPAAGFDGGVTLILDFPDDSVGSAWCLRIFLSKSSVSDDSLAK